jgi:tryptophan synthase
MKATLCRGSTGILHGTCTYLIQDAQGQIKPTHSISAGLDYPGVGPEHAHLKDCGRAEYVSATDSEAMIGFRTMSECEGILVALETAHAVFVAMRVAEEIGSSGDIVICVSGRGDKDVQTVAEMLPVIGPRIGWDLRF